ncbi:hypothetical protein D9758_009325 [Tetrapyrgos nigripes]|uniref:Uncharacterized protein n=1 Tax=Tetrapyrgos nigripes TaxID=182062 RepID=A0A8H5GHE4_9AGAR|nr:hypothetical protein D9758_009325 [Tetrapyrgos nigripes]
MSMSMSTPLTLSRLPPFCLRGSSLEDTITVLLTSTSIPTSTSTPRRALALPLVPGLGSAPSTGSSADDEEGITAEQQEEFERDQERQALLPEKEEQEQEDGHQQEQEDWDDLNDFDDPLQVSGYVNENMAYMEELESAYVTAKVHCLNCFWCNTQYSLFSFYNT